jgi:hypothetical protein
VSLPSQLAEAPDHDEPLVRAPRSRWRWAAVGAFLVLASGASVWLFLEHRDSGPFSIQRHTATLPLGSFGPPQGQPVVDGAKAVAIARTAKPVPFIPEVARTTAVLGHLIHQYPPSYEGDVWLVTAHDLCLPREGLYNGPTQYVLTDHVVAVDAGTGRLIGGKTSTSSLTACPEPIHAGM